MHRSFDSSSSLKVYYYIEMSNLVKKHVVVGFDYFARDIQCIPPGGVSTKVSIVKNVDFSFKTLDFNSERFIVIIHDVLGLMVDARNFVLNENVLGFNCRMPCHKNLCHLLIYTCT